MLNKYKQEITVALFVIGFIAAFIYLYGIVLPFVIGLITVFAVAPLILKIKKKVKSWNLAATIFLIATIATFTLSMIFLAKYINRDFHRLSSSFHVLVDNNQGKLDAAAVKVKDFARNLVDVEAIEKKLKAKADSAMTAMENLDSSEIDQQSIMTTIEDLFASFKLPGKQKEEKPSSPQRFSLTLIFFSSILYFLLILYNYEYFDGLRKKYFKGSAKSEFNQLLADFNNSFVLYFKLRTKIVLIISTIYLVGFLIMDMPGTVLITLLILLLSYIPYLQYVALLPLALACLVLSVETGHSYLLFLGITVGIFIVASIIEEAWLTPKIMEANIGMNPVVMVLSVSIWSYVMGLPGVLLAIPITGLLIIYIKRFFLTAYEDVVQDDQ